MSEPSNPHVENDRPEPCGHPCKCHAVNPDHDCDHPRADLSMNWYEEDALRRVVSECGMDAAVELVNRLLASTAKHQYAQGIKTGELWERATPATPPVGG